MIQPYFDPTVSFQGGSIFSQYLQGFVKERSAMNKQLMEMALSRSDPSFLQDQITLLNKNILELEKAKAKASTGNTGDALAYARLYAGFGRIEAQGYKDIAVAETERGGRAAIDMNQAESLVTNVIQNAGVSDDTEIQKEVAIQLASMKMNTPQQRQAVVAAINGSDLQDKVTFSDLGLPSSSETRDTFLARTAGTATRGIPGALGMSEKSVAFGQKMAGGSPEQRAASTANIDAAIASYKTKLEKYEQQLVELQAGGGDVFSGFSRNYMLDNPFIQMSRQQGAVDALAAAVEESSKEDYTVPFDSGLELESRFEFERDPETGQQEYLAFRSDPEFRGKQPSMAQEELDKRVVEGQTLTETVYRPQGFVGRGDEPLRMELSSEIGEIDDDMYLARSLSGYDDPLNRPQQPKKEATSGSYKEVDFSNVQGSIKGRILASLDQDGIPNPTTLQVLREATKLGEPISFREARQFSKERERELEEYNKRSKKGAE